MTDHIAEKCKHCHLFIEDQSDYADEMKATGVTIARFIHLHRGDEADEAIEATHEAESSGLKATIDTWQAYGPRQMVERFLPRDFDPIKDEARPDAVGVALLAGVPWEQAKHHSYEVLALLESVREADAAAEGDSNDSEISWLSGSLEEALYRWPDLAALRSATP